MTPDQEREQMDEQNQKFAESMRHVHRVSAAASMAMTTVVVATAEAVALFDTHEADTLQRDASRALEAVQRSRASMARFLDRIECPYDPARPINRDIPPRDDCEPLTPAPKQAPPKRATFRQELASLLRAWADRIEGNPSDDR